MIATPAFSELELKGRMEQGGMVVGRTEAGTEIFLDGRRVRVGDDGRFVFGFSWDAPQTATIDVSLPDGSRERLELAIKPQEYRVERIDGLPPKTVTIPEEERRRRTLERAMVVKARAGNTDLRDWLSTAMIDDCSTVSASSK